MKIINKTKATTIAENAVVADTFLSRIVGLLNHQSLKAGEALMIEPCQAIHMFFMKFSIDAIFVSKDDRVVGLVEAIRPFQASAIFWQARFVIEVPAGTIKTSRTQKGDTLEIKPYP